MNNYYLAVPVGENCKMPKEDHGFIMTWEVELIPNNWIYKAREGDLFHLKEYSKLSNVRNLHWLEPTEGVLLQTEELEELLLRQKEACAQAIWEIKNIDILTKGDIAARALNAVLKIDFLTSKSEVK